MQVTTSLAMGYSVRMPDLFRQFAGILGLANLDMFQLIPIECYMEHCGALGERPHAHNSVTRPPTHTARATTPHSRPRATDCPDGYAHQGECVRATTDRNRRARAPATYHPTSAQVGDTLSDRLLRLRVLHLRTDLTHDHALLPVQGVLWKGNAQTWLSLRHKNPHLPSASATPHRPRSSTTERR